MPSSPNSTTTPAHPRHPRPRPTCEVCGRKAGGGFRLCWTHLGMLLDLTRKTMDVLTPEETRLLHLTTPLGGGIEA